MGLVDVLGYEYRSPTGVHKLVQGFATSAPGAWVSSHTLHHVDRLVSNLTKGKTTASEVLAGLPVIEVTTTGAKSGQPRTAQLLGIPTRENLAIIGSGFGQTPTPGWVYNLRANPEAGVRYRNRDASALAREAEAAELDEIWATARSIYHGYAIYPERASHRQIAVFALEPR